ncbi:MAG: ATP-binding protein [Verrucomicrobiae bacterium]|nr:ATP-binding protein [Verrucomicrobiae bacterium]
MKSTVNLLIDEALRRPLPELVVRDTVIRRVPGRASVLTGMRRSGKTWLCFQQMRDLIAKGTPREKMLYINFDDERLAGFALQDFQWLLERYFALFPSFRKETCHFFFDEIQNVPGWERFIRRLLDTEKAEVTVTGSSAKLLSLEVASCLRGRGFATEVFPLSFREFCRFHRVEIPADGVYGAICRSRLLHAAERYLEIGGFPEIQTEPWETARELLQDYVNTVILRDVAERHHVANLPALRALSRQVLQNPAAALSMTRFEGMMKQMGIPCGRNLLYAMAGHLQDAYLFFPAEIHSRSVRKRQVNPRKYYAVDTGLLNAFSLGLTQDRGALLESMVFLALRRRGIHPDYYRTVSGHEVDFFFSTSDKTWLAQACWSLENKETRARERRALDEAKKETNPTRSLIITLDEEEDTTNGIRVVPLWRWLLEMEPIN